ncbi:MAG: methyltransferase domain-containing protein [Elusimicrobiota bacterium]|nr:methyltransferase domain-containing protein [Elusimicrobiota bacterium]
MKEKSFYLNNDYRAYLLERFNRISKIYDTLMFLFPDYLRKIPVELSGVNSNSKVIDVCTGTGNLAIEFAKYAGEVVGVDISPEMLKIAQSKNSKVRFMLMDATKLQFLDKSFDIASISTALHEMPSHVREKVLKEMIRVTKEKIIVVDYKPPTNPILKSLYTKIISIYESKYFLEFTSNNLKDFFYSSGLKIEQEKKVFGIFCVYVCNILPHTLPECSA